MRWEWLRNGVMATSWMILLAASAFSQSRISALDHISTNALERFDLRGALVDNRLRITTIEDGAVIPSNHQHPTVAWETAGDSSALFWSS